MLKHNGPYQILKALFIPTYGLRLCDGNIVDLVNAMSQILLPLYP